MGKQISLTLPDDLFRLAEMLAGRSGRELADVLTDAIESSLDPLGTSGEYLPPLAASSDEAVLAAADSTMTAQDDQRLSDLLDLQREGTLSQAESGELRALMQVYQQGTLRKSEGIREAVRRGLRGAPQS